MSGIHRLYIIFFSLAMLGVLEHAKAVAICFDADARPFMYMENGKAVGLYPALASAIFQFAKIPIEMEAKPWKRCLADVDSGLSGAGGILKNSIRLSKYDYSLPIYIERIAVYCSRSHPIPFHGLQDLYHKRVGILRGWSYGDTFDMAVKKGRIHTEEVGSDQQNFEKLTLGRLDAVLVIEQTGSALMRNPRFSSLEKFPIPLRSSPSFIAFAKTAKQSALIDKINRAIVQLTRSGQIEEIAANQFSRPVR